jgi:hypothetical protein
LAWFVFFLLFLPGLKVYEVPHSLVSSNILQIVQRASGSGVPGSF